MFQVTQKACIKQTAPGYFQESGDVAARGQIGE